MKEIDFLPTWYRSSRWRQISYRTKYASSVGIFVVMKMWNFIATHLLSKAVAKLAQAELKSARNLYVIVAGIVAGSLFAAGFATWYYSGGEGGLHFAGYVFVWPVCCLVAAVGVILLGWYWIRLTGKISSIIKELKANKTSRIKSGGCKIAGELSEAINACFDGNRSYIEELEKQIEDSQLKIQLLRRQKRNTDAIIYSIRDGVIVIDEFDRLLMANEAAGKLFNFDCKSSQHKPISELVCGGKTKAGENEFVDFLRQSRQSKVRHRRREIDFSSEEEAKTFNCVVSCVYGEEEQVCGVVAVLHDITREKGISRVKNDFVNHVSHELKTPLASISAYSEMLADGEADNEQTRREFYSVIQNQAKRLNRLIEDTLNTSRIESGLVKVEKKPVSLTILIEEQLRMIRSYAEEKSIEIIGQKPIVFDRVYVDKDMISQVIVNLLSNAVKYTPCGGSIKIETEVDEVASLARVRVTDTGVGIAEDEIEHVFDKFYRVGANKEQAEGTGMGLNLVKQIVEKIHNGRVFVTSEPGGGSTFGFELPLATAGVVEV
jgi:two-component system phosphate regulon sensor histidine kinase PhoR